MRKNDSFPCKPPKVIPILSGTSAHYIIYCTKSCCVREFPKYVSSIFFHLPVVTSTINLAPLTITSYATAQGTETHFLLCRASLCLDNGWIYPHPSGLRHWHWGNHTHYDDVIMGAMASQITSLTIVYSTVYSCADQTKHQSSALLAFVRGIHRGPVNSPHKWPVTRKMFPFDDVIMNCPTMQVKQPW